MLRLTWYAVYHPKAVASICLSKLSISLVSGCHTLLSVRPEGDPTWRWRIDEPSLWLKMVGWD